MKVRDLLNKLEAEEKIFKCLQTLETTLRNNPELRGEIDQACELPMSVHDIIKEARMHYCDSVYALKSRIMDIDIPN